MTVESGHTQAVRGGVPEDSFANRLILARAHAGHISIRDAAQLAGLGRGAWTNWERGARPADILDVAEVVADKLGVDRDWLLFGGGLASSDRRRVPLSRNSAVTSVRPVRKSIVRTPDRRPIDRGPRSPSAVRPISAVPISKRRPGPVRPMAGVR